MGTVEQYPTLPGGRWRVWPWVELRGAGIPADRLLALAAPRTVEAVSRRLDLEAAGAKLPPMAEWLRELEPLFEQEHRACAEALLALAREPLFKEALVWQNRAFFEFYERQLRKWMDPAHPAKLNSDARQFLRTLAGYAQRYAAKNDSIGFFGPVGWARVDADPRLALEAIPGEGLVSGRRAFLEHWAVAALASKLCEDARFRQQVPVRLAVGAKLEGAMLRPAPGAKRVGPIQPQWAAILGRCDGRRSAARIARELVARPELGFRDPAHVLELISTLAERKLVVWELEVPTVGRPEELLRGMLERFEDPEPRAVGLAQLGALERARDAVGAAAGDAERVNEALGALEETFTELTSRAATRLGGVTYAGRTLVYEECRRDLEMRIGPRLLERLGPALSLVLAGARWFTAELGERYHQQLVAAYRAALGGRPLGAPVDGEELWSRAQALSARWVKPAPAFLAELTAEFQRRWAEVLAPGAGPVVRKSAELAARVAELFPPGKLRTPMGRYQSPDLMMIAQSPEAIARGEVGFVLGEVHMGSNTLNVRWALESHPDPSWVAKAMEADLPGGWATPLFGRTEANRGHLTMLAASEREVTLTLDEAPAPDWSVRGPSLALRELEVFEEEGRLWAREPGGHRWDAMLIFEFFASAVSVPLLPRARHNPRVQIDDLVVMRESWTFAAEELAFASAKSRLSELVEARRWMRRQGLPRFVFVRNDKELKPWQIDLANPISVGLLAKEARGADRLTVSEMLPGMDQLWLRDRHGARYTSELRMLCVDPEP